MAHQKTGRREPEVVRGARALADYIFGDPDQWRTVYGLAPELGLFRMGGFLCGRPATIRARLAARERKGKRRNSSKSATETNTQA